MLRYETAGESHGETLVAMLTGLPAGVPVSLEKIDRELWRRGHRPATVSKYGTGMTALHPSLPSNCWNRVLARHFARASISAVSATKPTDLDAGAAALRRREARRALASAR